MSTDMPKRAWLIDSSTINNAVVTVEDVEWKPIYVRSEDDIVEVLAPFTKARFNCLQKE